KGVQAPIKALEVLEVLEASPAPPSVRTSRAASADAPAAAQTAGGGDPQALDRAPLVSLRGAALHALATLVALSAALEATGAALASATNGLASMRNALEAVFAVASVGLGAVLDRFASEPSGALAATFFAGSAAGAVSMIVVLSLGWVVVRGLRR
ncbi:MAG: hypothetical protein MUF34_38310, partial [Polyangiaceae bacterium]|nr:hypothetical protein [Polyangiaceae bacterium]